MSDVESAISEWRSRLAASGSLTSEDLDELESHLRDHLDALEEVGITGVEAIAIALDRAGDAADLGDEYAKAHPLRAWAQPAAWAAVGLFFTLVGDGLSRAAVSITLHAGVALGLREQAMVPMIWLAGVGAPLALVVAAFAVVRRQATTTSSLSSSPVARVALLASTGVVMIVGTATQQLVGFTAWSDVHDYAFLNALFSTTWDASYVAAVAVPCAIGGYALFARKSTGGAAVVWSAIGALASFVALGTEESVRFATYASSPMLQLHIPGVRMLTWVVAFAVPLACLAAFTLSLRRSVARPADFVSGRASIVALLGLTTAPLALEAVIYVARGFAWEATGASLAYLHGIYALRHAALAGMPVFAVAAAGLYLVLRHSSTRTAPDARVNPSA